MSKTPRPNSKIYHCSTALSEQVAEEVQSKVTPGSLLLWTRNDLNWRDFTRDHGFDPDEYEDTSSVHRIVLVHEGIPIDAKLLSDWRETLLKQVKCEVGCLYLKGNESKDEVIKNLTRRFPTLLTSPAVPETPAFRVGDLIKPQKEGDADGKLLLTMFFDSLGEMLTEMDGIKSRFQKKIGNAINKKPDYLKKLKVILGAEDPNEAPIPREIVDEDKELRATRTEIPRVLLLGETGVGKTLFANYLEQSGKRVTRLSIAEFIDKEDMLEYELFGYAKGSYSGALNKGYEGLLQGNRGGILFLDEIGTATHTIQAKLLAFLDDFMVRPRGLSHSFFCPILIVAATNEDVYNATDNEESRYRQDLFQRFTDVHRIPPLRDMKNNLDYLVDIMLQNESINIDRRIETVGKDALSALMKLEYQTGNFRELMNRLRWACKTAHKNGRSYLISQDITAYPEPGKFNPSA